MLKTSHVLWLLFALLVLLGATPEHPNHLVRPDRIQATAADNGKYLQVVGSTPQWSDGVPVPLFATNATLNPIAGLPTITRDPVTGVLTLPSVPNPAASLRLYANGARQAWGRDFTVSGAIVTPGPDVTVNGVLYSPKAVFLNALEIVGDWQR